MFSENGNTLKRIAAGGHDASYSVLIDYQYRTIVVKVFGLCGYWKKNPERKFVLTCENKQKPDKPYRMHPYCALPNSSGLYMNFYMYYVDIPNEMPVIINSLTCIAYVTENENETEISLN